uniref:Uncharacterized protein n=1 Tax=Romanomermis culicivorax TaxID=13658 RepID=A0A915HNN7_ROMCU
MFCELRILYSKISECVARDGIFLRICMSKRRILEKRKSSISQFKIIRMTTANVRPGVYSAE